jgi:hypothetical protein
LKPHFTARIGLGSCQGSREIPHDQFNTSRDHRAVVLTKVAFHRVLASEYGDSWLGQITPHRDMVRKC